MEIRKSLETNFLTCRICSQPFREPKVLLCLHTFCKACLERILEQDKLNAAKKRREIEQQRSSGYSSSSSMSTYKGRWSRAFKTSSYSTDDYNGYTKHRFSEDEILCPVCEKKTTLPMSGVHGLPDDQLAGKLASIVGKIPNYPICDVCSGSNFHGVDAESPDTTSNEIHRLQVPRRPWTDVDDDSSSSSAIESTTGEEDDSQRKRPFGFRSNNKLKPPRRYRQVQKKKLVNMSDDEIRMPVSAENTEPNRAIAACLECAKRLCGFCHKNHTKLTVTADHVIVSLEQLDMMACSRHPRELRRFFCVTCAELICLVCTFESAALDGNFSDPKQEIAIPSGHAEHEVLSIRQGLTCLERYINKSAFDCKQKADRLELLLLGIRSCESHVNSLKSTVTAASEAMIQTINNKRLALFNELDQDIGVKAESLSKQCELIANSLASWEELRSEDDYLQNIACLHPIQALSEASLVRDRFLGCLEVLTASIPTNDGWPKLITEINNFSKLDVEDRQPKSDESEVGIKDKDTQTNSSNKCSKRVRFKPPAECAGVIPPSYSAHWTRRLGKFLQGYGVNFGRRATPGQLAAEAAKREEKVMNRAVQASPTDVHGKPLPAERDSRRHRAIQVDLLQANKDDQSVQTEVCTIAPIMSVKTKQDAGTQYLSADVNTPISFFRSSRQIVVQQ